MEARAGRRPSAGAEVDGENLVFVQQAPPPSRHKVLPLAHRLWHAAGVVGLATEALVLDMHQEVWPLDLQVDARARAAALAAHGEAIASGQDSTA